MDAIVNLGLVVVASAPFGIAAAWILGRGPALIGTAFRPWSGDPWPVGVQEEDPGHRFWNWEATPARVPGDASAVEIRAADGPLIAFVPAAGESRVLGPRRLEGSVGEIEDRVESTVVVERVQGRLHRRGDS